MGLVALVLVMVGRVAGNLVTSLQCAGEGNTRPRLPPGQLRFRLRSLSLFAFIRVNSSLPPREEGCPCSLRSTSQPQAHRTPFIAVLMYFSFVGIPFLRFCGRMMFDAYGASSRSDSTTVAAAVAEVSQAIAC